MDFKNVKKQVLSAKDLSKKGSVDDAIHSLVNYINSRENYVTTSSCSGRAILLSVNTEIPTKKAKKDCDWLFTTHNCFEAEDLIRVADPSNGDLLFKFEPFILHVMCAHLEAATTLVCSISLILLPTPLEQLRATTTILHYFKSVGSDVIFNFFGSLRIAIGAGYRESGMTIGSHGKIIVAIRSNIRLEVPISEDSVMLVSDAYFMTLARKANEKFESNFMKIKIFQTVLEETMEGKLHDAAEHG